MLGEEALVHASATALVSAGIPVMAHVGLSPQAVHQLGGYKVQRDEERLLHDATTAEAAGAFSVLLECVASSIAKKITDALRVPTIGIGAGAGCDGQVLVINDMLGMFERFTPKFVKKYCNLNAQMKEGVKKYIDEVKSGAFPDEEHSI